MEHEFIELSYSKFSTDFKPAVNSYGINYAFQGEHNAVDLPDGFVRTVDDYGNIFEGNFTSDGRMNGWCIGFSGKFNEIEMGWYKNDKVVGNWMKLNADDLQVVCSGWFENGVCVSPMKDDSKYKNFTPDDIFMDHLDHFMGSGDDLLDLYGEYQDEEDGEEE